MTSIIENTTRYQNATIQHISDYEMFNLAMSKCYDKAEELRAEERDHEAEIQEDLAIDIANARDGRSFDEYGFFND